MSDPAPKPPLVDMQTERVIVPEIQIGKDGRFYSGPPGPLIAGAVGLFVALAVALFLLLSKRNRK